MSQARSQLTDDDKKDLALEYCNLLIKQARGIGNTYGRVSALCNRWGVSRNYCAKILKAGTTKDGKVLLNRKIRQFTGVKIMDRRENEQALIDIMKERTDGVSNRQLLRAFNKRTGQRKVLSLIQAKLTSMGAQKHKPEMRPKLKREHKVARKIFATSMLDNRYKFWFDIDEKLFFCKTVNGYVWTLPGHMTDAEVRNLKEKHVESKSHVTKVMVVTAVGRPFTDGDFHFDGKGFMARCSVPYVAKKDSTLHKKGDRYDKDVNVNGTLYVHLIKQLLARFTVLFGAKYPDQIITVQHDGAGPHRSIWAEKMVTDLGAINVPQVVFMRQNPQSPEQNANDLAVYRHLGAVVAEFDYRTAEDLMNAIIAAWTNIPEDLLDRVFAMKCLVFREIVRMNGDSIKIPGVGLRAAQKAGILWRFVEDTMRF